MTGPLSMNYRVLQDYTIMSTLFHPCQQLMDEVWSQALRLTHWDTHRHIRVVISRSLGVQLDKGAVVAIPLAAVAPTHGQIQQVWGEERREAKRWGETRVQSRGALVESSSENKLFGALIWQVKEHVTHSPGWCRLFRFCSFWHSVNVILHNNLQTR